MAIDETALAGELAGRHGVTTAQRLAVIGIGRRAIDTLEHRMAMACAATGGVVCFPTAGVVWRLRKSSRSPDVHVWVTEEGRARAPGGVRVHYTRHLPETDVVRRADGVAITAPRRTAFDAAGWLDRDDLESFIEHGLDRGCFIVPTLWTVHGAAATRGRRGSRRFADVLRSRPAWRRPARSDHELRLEGAWIEWQRLIA